MAPIRAKQVHRCRICTRDCFYFFYGVQACEGCKQFFRRVVLKQQAYLCQKGQNCKIMEGDLCRGCRLRKCLVMGMDPYMVQLRRGEHYCEKIMAFIAKLKRRQRELQREERGEEGEEKEAEGAKGEEEEEQQFLAPLLHDSSNAVCRLINSAVPLERAYKQIWESTRPLTAEYVSRYENVQELLGDTGRSLLDTADYFATGPCWDRAQFLEDFDRRGLFGSEYIKIVAKDWFLAVETAKSMPFFKQLDIDDQKNMLIWAATLLINKCHAIPNGPVLLKQIVILQHTIVQVNSLGAAFYSNAKCAKTITRGNGMTPICMIEADKFRGDEKIRSLYKQANSEAVERLNQASIGYEEFLLLFCTLFANSNATNLSARGRELVYAEAVRYSGALHQLLRAKYGPVEGAKKFAVAMGLLDVVHRMHFLYRDFIIKMELFYERKNPSEAMPKAMAFFPKFVLQ